MRHPHTKGSSVYTPPQPDLWRGREDTHAGRFFQHVTCVDLRNQTPTKAIVLLGFGCDLGVVRNAGRAGAAAGPTALRQALANLPFHAQKSLVDVGDIVAAGLSLAEAQSELAKTVMHLKQHDCLPIIIGGGHETAWGTYQGLLEAPPTHIVNFDAHFDMRPVLPDGMGSSGTPFLQIAEDCVRAGRDFHYTVLGTQRLANTPELFETAAQYGVHDISAVLWADAPRRVHRKISHMIKKAYGLYVSCCLDVFSASVAPGVSAPQPLGVMPALMLPIWRLLAQSGKIDAIDLVELAPSLDHNGQTARLGASLVAQFVEDLCL